jgi:hypothetical protein
LKSLFVEMVNRAEYGTKKNSDNNEHGAWRPREFSDFDDGGAFPEIDVVQFPNRIGWNEDENDCIASTEYNFAKLTLMHAEQQLKVVGVEKTSARTSAYASFVDFMRAFNEQEVCTNISKFGSLRSAKDVQIVDDALIDSVEFEKEFVTSFDGIGLPCVVKNVCCDDFDIDLLSMYGDEEITINDLAPARRTDVEENKQKTLITTAKRYAQYLHEYENSNKQQSPYYNNGWRIFSKYPDLKHSFFEMQPRFLKDIDQTEIILRQTFEILSKSLPRNALSNNIEEMTASVNQSLNKAFIGPVGCVTRLHHDASDAHGFLAQTKGKKLFVLFHPRSDVDATNCCCSSSSSNDDDNNKSEKNQSLIDPLKFVPVKARENMYSVVVEPGEAIFIPRGWWHYAVSLETSQTVMRNWFHATTNAKGLVEMMLKSVNKTVSKNTK